MSDSRKFRLLITEVHPDDPLYLGNSAVYVMAVNREKRRVLVRGRKFSTRNFSKGWVELCELSTRPEKHFETRFATIHELTAVTNDNVRDWEPRRKPKRTKAIPGTAAKKRILSNRVEAGEKLWSDDDATLGDVVKIEEPPKDAGTKELIRVYRTWLED